VSAVRSDITTGWLVDTCYTHSSHLGKILPVQGKFIYASRPSRMGAENQANSRILRLFGDIRLRVGGASGEPAFQVVVIYSRTLRNPYNRF